MKRFFDFLIAILAIFVLSPVFITIILVIFFKQGRPIFFTQKRLGLNAKVFNIYKFRTMTTGAHLVRDGLQVTSNDVRVTKVGKVLRSTSLDELPQLFNILLGDVAIVGPRACLPEQLPYFNKKQRERFRVRPGLTGLATIKGRASIRWSKRLRWDRVYINQQSLWLDIKIIIRTVFVVLSRENIYYDHSKYGPAFDLATPDDLPQAVAEENER
ncbi:sugar transferase [Planktotalea sp.]|uniref:sugar transferase n=1 Tax=Planktotalea sp. TaxID=2029877 RepID=UPI0035C86022